MQSSGILTGLTRAGRMLALCAVVAAALLTFPGAIPWMIAFWLLWHSAAVLGGRRGWLPLVLCAAVVFAKRTAWTPGLGVLALAAAGVVAVRFIKGSGVFFHVGGQGQTTADDVVADMEKDSRPPRPGRWAWASLAVLWIAWGVMVLEWRAAARCGRPVTLRPGRPVVCLGDSMTSMGPPRGGYPEHLVDLISLPVVNCGRPGITTEQALRDLLPQVLAADPQVVVIELGGNDFVQGRTRQSAKKNLEAILTACRASGAEVVLMETPRGYMVDPFAGLERELAREHDLELVSDTAVRRLLLASPTLPPGMWGNGPFLTDPDGLHPNALGNQLLAQYVAEALQRMYGPGIRKASNEF